MENLVIELAEQESILTARPFRYNCQFENKKEAHNEENGYEF